MDGDGPRQLLKTPYEDALFSKCTHTGPAFFSMGVCGPESIMGCASAESSNSCIFVAHSDPYAPSDDLVRGHYVDRDGQCFQLVSTVLNVDAMLSSGQRLTGSFAATGIGPARLGRLSLTGRFVACAVIEKVRCE